MFEFKKNYNDWFSTITPNVSFESVFGGQSTLSSRVIKFLCLSLFSTSTKPCNNGKFFLSLSFLVIFDARHKFQGKFHSITPIAFLIGRPIFICIYCGKPQGTHTICLWNRLYCNIIVNVLYLPFPSSVAVCDFEGFWVHCLKGGQFIQSKVTQLLLRFNPCTHLAIYRYRWRTVNTVH